MPWGVAAAVGSGIAGAATSSLLSPGTSGGGNSYYTPTGLGTADTTWQNLLDQQLGSQGQVYGTLPYYQQSLNQGLSVNNGYAPQYQGAANTAGGMYSSLGNSLANAGGLQLQQQGNLINAGQQVYNTAFDPQNALYNRTAQQLQDQTGATNSMYGLGSSAAGAGVADQAMSNFNIDWQNQQLQRQISGLQGYGQAVGQAGQSAGQAGALSSAGAGYTLQGGQLPYQTAQGIAGVPGQLGSTYAGQIQQGPLSSANAISSQIIPYLNYGQGAQAVPYQSATQGAGAAGALLSQGIQGLGSNSQVQSALGSYFGSPTGSFSGGDFGGAFTSNPYYSGGGNSYGFTM
jgi:hypothetical protein